MEVIVLDSDLPNLWLVRNPSFEQLWNGNWDMVSTWDYCQRDRMGSAMLPPVDITILNKL